MCSARAVRSLGARCKCHVGKREGIDPHSQDQTILRHPVGAAPERNRLRVEAHADQVYVVGEAASVADAARLVHATDADVVFLDIQLAGETGMDLLPLLGADVDVVFVTAYDEYRSAPSR